MLRTVQQFHTRPGTDSQVPGFLTIPFRQGGVRSFLRVADFHPAGCAGGRESA